MAHPSMACVRLFDKNPLTYDYHKQIQDSQGVSALRSFVTSDSTALAVVSALVLTISVPLLLVREEDFVDQSADNTIFHFANTVFCTISIIASVCCITSRFAHHAPFDESSRRKLVGLHLVHQRPLLE